MVNKKMINFNSKFQTVIMTKSKLKQKRLSIIQITNKLKIKKVRSLKTIIDNIMMILRLITINLNKIQSKTKLKLKIINPIQRIQKLTNSRVKIINNIFKNNCKKN